MNASWPIIPAHEAVTFEAHWVFPGVGLPLPEGTVTIQAGRIVAVEPAGSRTPDLDLGHVALLPGFVNAHTHLDLSDAVGLDPSGSPIDWLKRVIQHRRNQSDEARQQALWTGLQQLLRSGTTLVGDISAFGASWDHLNESPLRSLVFYEMLGLSETRAAESEAAVRAWLQAHPATGRCHPGVSPHAPYSVRASLFQSAAGFDVPCAIHLAEFLEEKTLLEHREGPFLGFLHELGVWDPNGFAANWDEIVQLPWARPPLWIHANHANLPLGTRGSVIYCPRTYAAFGQPHHPFRVFSEKGINVALGTDSLASNPDLDILAEVRWLHAQRQDLSGEVLLRMITLGGAKALGLDALTGSLTPRKSADLVVLPLPDREMSDPYRLLWESDTRPAQVLFEGQWR